MEEIFKGSLTIEQSSSYKISFLLFVSHFKWIEKLSWSDSSVHYNGYKIDKSAAEKGRGGRMSGKFSPN